MSETPQWYRDYLEDVSQQVRWVDRIRFRQAIHQAVPGLLQQGAEGETLLSLLVADFNFSPSPTTMDSSGTVVHEAAHHCISSSTPLGRCLFVLTSHNLHALPFLSPTITTFTPRQIWLYWRINNKLHTIEIPFWPPDVLEELERPRPDGESFDALPHAKALILRVDPQDWAAASVFWAAGLVTTSHWGDPATIARELATMMQNIRK